MALATDCNPGSSPVTSLLAILNLACNLFGLTPEEALAGVTRHAARALGLDDRGTLAVGQRADLALWRIHRPAELSYWLGFAPPEIVLRDGRRSYGRAPRDPACVRANLQQNCVISVDVTDREASRCPLWNGGTDLKPVAPSLSDFSPRLPWWGGDLQTIRNYALSLDHALPSRAARRSSCRCGTAAAIDWSLRCTCPTRAATGRWSC